MFFVLCLCQTWSSLDRCRERARVCWQRYAGRLETDLARLRLCLASVCMVIGSLTFETMDDYPVHTEFLRKS